MREITITELAGNLRQILDTVESMGEEILIVHNKRHIARIVPGVVYLTALEAMTDLYNTLPEDAAAGWFEDSRQPFSRAAEAGEAPGYVDEMRDPWDS
jgi:antitoxin (DNA-binding transcriptional repressor) of toxin-antitoxin stability system